MTRSEQLAILSKRYWIMMQKRRWKAVADLHARMKELMGKQLRYEIRKEKHG